MPDSLRKRAIEVALRKAMNAMTTFKRIAVNSIMKAGTTDGARAAWPVRAITLEIVPGPLSRGMAIGMSAMSSRCLLSMSSGVCRTRSGRASIMSKAILSSNSPATIRNASIVTPNKWKMRFPNRANATRTTNTINSARFTICARCRGVYSGVIERKIGMFPMASSVTKIDTNAVIKKV